MDRTSKNLVKSVLHVESCYVAHRANCLRQLLRSPCRRRRVYSFQETILTDLTWYVWRDKHFESVKVNFVRSEALLCVFNKTKSYRYTVTKKRTSYSKLLEGRGSSRVMSAWEAILKVVCLYNGSVQRLRTTIGISCGVIFAQICVIFPPQSLPLVFQK